MHRTITTTALAALLAASAAACDSGGYYYYDDAYAAYETAYWLDWEDSYYWYGYDPLYGYYWIGEDEQPTPEEAATMIAAMAPDFFSPPDCVDASADGATATLELDACTGPQALREVSGEIELTYSDAQGGVGLDLSTDGLRIDDSPLEILSTSTATVEGDTIVVNAHTSIAGFSRTVGEVDRTGDYVVRWENGDDCRQVEGTIEDRGADTATITIEGYERCGDLCPERGTITRVKGDRTVEVTFDGSNQADWVSDTGQDGTIDLDCE